MTAAPEGADEQAGSAVASDVRARATTGAALLGARSAAIYALGTVANLWLAHLLTPSDFGIVALGTVLVVLGSYLAEGGFGASLIRRDAEPRHEELAAVNALQLGVTTLVAAVTAAVAAPFGEDGLVIATMVVALPIIVLRAPSMIVLERRLEYRAIATADVVEALTYYVWAVGSVLLGMGVWGLATAVVVRALVGSATLLALGPIGPVRPRWAWPLVRPLLGFGAQVQLAALLAVAREQLLNVVIAVVAGVATLGVWNLAWRVLQAPLLLAQTIGRVAFPAMSRILQAKQDPRQYVERGVGVTALLMGVVAVALASLAPLLPEIVGDSWGDVPEVLFWCALALVLGPPITVGTTGYLLAAGEARVVALATGVSALAWFAVAAALLPRYGPAAAGIGWVVAAIVNGAFLWRRAAAMSGASVLGRHGAATAVSVVSLTGAWLVASGAGSVLLGAAAGLAGGWLVLLVGARATSPAALRDTRRLIAAAPGRGRA